MIDWQPIAALPERLKDDTPDSFSPAVLVWHKGEAEVARWDRDSDSWVTVIESLPLDAVTHFAEITAPASGAEAKALFGAVERRNLDL